jgi:hypothetical protein
MEHLDEQEPRVRRDVAGQPLAQKVHTITACLGILARQVHDPGPERLQIRRGDHQLTHPTSQRTNDINVRALAR